jgi:hypothetical protein
VYDGYGNPHDVSFVSLAIDNSECKWRVFTKDSCYRYFPDELSLTKQDSLERIISDMSADIDLMKQCYTRDEAIESMEEYHDRIKALADKEGGSDD